jgi:hypothetical protein
MTTVSICLSVGDDVGYLIQKRVREQVVGTLSLYLFTSRIPLLIKGAIIGESIKILIKSLLEGMEEERSIRKLAWDGELSDHQRRECPRRQGLFCHVETL